MKGRMSAVDIRAIVAELRQKIIGLRLQNVYDINAKTYLLKFSRPDKKVFLMVESGVRLHTTQFARDKSTVPSGFTMKIRKHLRTRRLEDVRQLGMDRVVDFQFGTGENCYHLLCEFYARGNILLCDHEYTILSLLRTHRGDDAAGAVGAAASAAPAAGTWAVHQTYPFASSRTYQPPTPKALAEGLARTLFTQPDVTLRQALSSFLDYGPQFIDHCLASLSSSMKPLAKLSSLDLSTTSDKGKENLQKLSDALSDADQFIRDAQEVPQKGYIVNKNASAPASSSEGKKASKKDKAAESLEDPEAQAANFVSIYDDFAPYKFAQMAGKDVVEFDSFDAAVDEFFSKIEAQKQEAQRVAQEQAAVKKLEKMKLETGQRLQGLKGAQEEDERKASIIQANAEEVDAAISVVRSALAQAVDWNELARVIKEQKKMGNPIAAIIHSLKLETNQITLLLSAPTYESEGDDDDDLDSEEEDNANTRPLEKVDVDLSQSAYANASLYHDRRKKAAVKEFKTVEATGKAYKAAEKKAMDSIKEVRVSAGIQLMRRVLWFEKFDWCISSENYLLLAGRDAQQNEQLVKRYLRKGDLYVHADIHGAASVILKNPTGAPIPPLTLSQAGMMSVCHSSAWDAKIITSAWWVNAEQVSKTAPSGEYLPTGSFVIRGKKNFLPPQPLMMGFGFLFKLDDSSVANHFGERRAKSGRNDDASSVADSSIMMDQDLDVDDSEDAASSSAVSSVAETLASSSLSHAKSDEMNHDDDQQEEEQHDEEHEEEGEKEEEEQEKEESVEGVQSMPRLTAASLAASNQAAGSASNSKKEEENDDADQEAAGVALNWNKYGLDDLSKEAEKDPMAEVEAEIERLAAGGANNQSGKKKGHVSAAERRKMKKAAGKGKGDQLEDGDEAEGSQPAAQSNASSKKSKEKKILESDDETPDYSEAPKLSAGKSKKEKQEQQPQPQQPQQSKRKSKKKDKFADMDEDEIELSKFLLGAKNPDLEKKREEERKKKEAIEAKARAKQQQAQKQRQQAAGKSAAKVEPSIISVDDDTIASSAASAADAIDAANAEEADEIKKMLEEEDGAALADEDLDKLTELDSLTGIPKEGDTLLFAIPVCAPYSSMLPYKYKVKLTPGTLKKGKAAKQALSVFLQDPSASQHEKDLIKNIPENSLFTTIMGDCKVQVAGLYNINSKVKSQKKQAKKSEEKQKSGQKS